MKVSRFFFRRAIAASESKDAFFIKHSLSMWREIVVEHAFISPAANSCGGDACKLCGFAQSEELWRFRFDIGHLICARKTNTTGCGLFIETENFTFALSD